MLKKILYLALSIYLLSSQFTFANSSTLGVGWYAKTQQVPLFLTSENQGISWSLVSNENVMLPLNAKQVTLEGPIICNGKNCFSTGNYHLGNEDQFPLLLQTKDQGQSWQSIALPTPSNLGSGRLKNMSCNGLLCVAMGDGYLVDTGTTSLLFTSLDGGITWAYSSNFTNFPRPNLAEYLFDSTCTTDFCAAVGFYWTYKNKHAYGGPWPVLLTSNNKLDQWSFASIQGLTSKETMKFLQIKCTDKTCIVLGSMITYIDKGVIDINRPALIIGGLNNHPWTLITQIKHLPKLYAGFLNDINCMGDFCIITGEWIEKNISYTKRYIHPLVITSQDGGLTWVTSAALNQAPSLTFTHTFKNYCDQDVCLLSGKYLIPGRSSDNEAYAPMILRSTDKGQTWTPAPIQSIPTAMQDVTLYDLTCQGEVCIATGDYRNPSTIFSIPPCWLVSTNHGASWTFMDSSQISKFPSEGDASITGIGVLKV